MVIRSRRALLFFASAAMPFAPSGQAMAQSANSSNGAEEVSNDSIGNDIIVTAQRTEQRLQDVPISITVIDQKQLTNNNIVTAKDLAAYTPGLTVSTRYGSEASVFTIRGFSQEQRTTATVATYFADVVAPRGSGITNGGDGAGPGQLFDLQNVQVLKGPQGTLFGRNTTGGAVLIVPKKPTDKLEGYIEGTLGDFDYHRVQAALNVPISDALRIRLGVDRAVRDGYLRNIGLGPDRLGNTNYWALRGSVVWDVTPDIENYTILSYTHSKNDNVVPKIGFCDAARGISASDGFNTIPAGKLACDQMAREAPYGFWTVSSAISDSLSLLKQWQIINTTKWNISDNISLKNIFSYAELRHKNRLAAYGAFFPIAGVTADNVTSMAQVREFVPINGDPSTGWQNLQSSLVEELQLQGHSGDGRLFWQGGLYFESNRPLGTVGSLTNSWTPCADVNTLNCLGKSADSSSGTGTWSRYATSYRTIAAYAQASYDVSEKLKFTAGIRYTDDRSHSDLQVEGWSIASPGAAPVLVCSNGQAPGFGTPFTFAQAANMCKQSISATSHKPTWMIDVDWKPVENVMLYAKYTRGYRQGAVMPAAPDGLQTYRPEKIDAYEIGAKTSWRGAMPGTFNISAFYNDFTDQQLQIGFLSNGTVPGLPAATTAIVNAGRSRLKGFEAEISLSPFEGFRIDASYAYLSTRLLAVSTGGLSVAGYTVLPPEQNVALPFAAPHKATVSANYTLPMPEHLGKVSIGGTFFYQAGYWLTSAPTSSPFARLPEGYRWGNVNVSWEGVGGLPLDAGFFVTNVTNEKMYTFANDRFSRGFASYVLAEPRMYGIRLKYRFGN